MRRLPFKDGEFEAGLSVAAMDHLQRDDIPMAIAETARVLKPGGEFLFVTINSDFWVHLMMPLAIHGHGGYWGWRANEALWRQRFNDGGFDVVETGHAAGGALPAGEEAGAGGGALIGRRAAREQAARRAIVEPGSSVLPGAGRALRPRSRDAFPRLLAGRCSGGRTAARAAARRRSAPRTPRSGRRCRHRRAARRRRCAPLSRPSSAPPPDRHRCVGTTPRRPARRPRARRRARCGRRASCPASPPSVACGGLRAAAAASASRRSRAVVATLVLHAKSLKAVQARRILRIR